MIMFQEQMPLSEMQERVTETILSI